MESSDFDPMAGRKAAADLLEQYLRSAIDGKHVRLNWPCDDYIDPGTGDIDLGIDAVFTNCVAMLPEGNIDQIAAPDLAKAIRDLTHRCILFLQTDRPYAAGRVVYESVLVPIVVTVCLLASGVFLMLEFGKNFGLLGSQLLFWGFVITTGWLSVTISCRRVERLRHHKLLGPNRLSRWPFPEDPE